MKSTRQILSQTSRKTDVSMNDICGASRRKEVVLARREYIRSCLQNGWGNSAIAWGINKHHTSITHAIKVMKEEGEIA